jgi:hypothetical protein
MAKKTLKGLDLCWYYPIWPTTISFDMQCEQIFIWIPHSPPGFVVPRGRQDSRCLLSLLLSGALMRRPFCLLTNCSMVCPKSQLSQCLLFVSIRSLNLNVISYWSVGQILSIILFCSPSIFSGGEHHHLLHLLCRYAASFLISLLPWFLTVCI